MRATLRLALLLLLIQGLWACSAPPPPSTLGAKPTVPVRTPTMQPATAEEAIRQLIASEGQDVVQQDVEGLMNLWAVDAVVTDAKHTPDEPSDDAHWQGRDAIRDRYVVLVFPGNPGVAAPKDIKLSVTGDRASATGTTVIGKEVSPGGDRWEFAKRDGRWWITGLTYNLEPK
jgi:hypothetical protein